MSSEIKCRGPASAATIYFTILGSGTSIWSTSGGTGGFESYAAADWADYSISMTEQGSTNIYKGNVPAAVPAGVYDIDARRQIGGSPATTDVNVATGEVQWNGTKTLPLSDLVTSGQMAGIGPVRLAKAEAVSGFPVYFRSAADHVTPFTSGVCSGQISRNGAAFGALQSGNFTEIGQGWFRVNFTSGDLNATTIALIFSANGISGGSADPVPMAFVMQRTSGG